LTEILKVQYEEMTEQLIITISRLVVKWIPVEVPDNTAAILRRTDDDTIRLTQLQAGHTVSVCKQT